MQSFFLLGLAASSVLAALSANDEIVYRAPLQRRNLGASSYNSLFARQAGECPIGTTACADGNGCCDSFGGECCLDGCCQALYSCDPTGPEGQIEPCVCLGLGCPEPEEDDGDDSSSSIATAISSLATTAATISTTFSDNDVSTIVSTTTVPTSTAATTILDDDDAITSISTALLPPPQTTVIGSTPTESPTSESTTAGGSSGAIHVSGMGVVAVTMLAVCVGIAATAL